MNVNSQQVGLGGSHNWVAGLDMGPGIIPQQQPGINPIGFPNNNR